MYKGEIKMAIQGISATDKTVVVGTDKCSWCGDIGEVEVPTAGFFARQLGAPIQEAYPDLHKGLREQLVSGTHPECWTEMFGSH
jgi:hypothetical protein